MTTAIATKANFSEALYERFIAYLDAKPRTIETYTKNLRAFFSWVQNNGVINPSFEDVKAYRDYLNQSYKPSTVQAYIFVIRRFFEFTEQSGLYPNVAGKIKGATISREFKKDYLTASQVKGVVEGVTNPRDKAIIMLMVTCGLRDVEVSRAKVEDLRTMGANTVLFIQGKGREEKAEFVIVPPTVEAIIRAYLATRKDVKGTEPLFTSVSNNSKGAPLTTRSISSICKNAMISAGYNSDRLTAHSLRHTAVTLALLGGATIQEAQQFARHRNINTTQIYAHNLEAQSNKCSGLVADAIF